VCLSDEHILRRPAGIAIAAHARGHTVTLLTSHPEESRPAWSAFRFISHWTVRSSDLCRARGLDEASIHKTAVNAVIHSAAVSDYLVAALRADPVRV